MARASQKDIDVVERTRRLLSRRSGRICTQDEAEQVIADVAGFFDCLERWSRDQDGAPAKSKGTSKSVNRRSVS